MYRQCEHFNATLINMLGTWPEKPKSTWKEQVFTLVHAYNCTRNNMTDSSLYYLLFCRKPHLPVDILFGTNTADLKGKPSTKYVENLKWRIEWTYKTANGVVKKEQEQNKEHYDCKVRCAQVKVGDKVLLKCSAFKGKHKIQDRWENTTYDVIEQPLGKIPVFKIKSMEGDDKMKVVHRNLLLPLFSDPVDCTSELDTKSVVVQTVSTHEIIAVGAVSSHAQNMGACNRAWVTDMFQQG